MNGAQLTQAKTELQRMRSDVSYVELDYRDWWSRYLASHERHFFDILAWLPPERRRGRCRIESPRLGQTR